jgi:hypothetical protein
MIYAVSALKKIKIYIDANAFLIGKSLIRNDYYFIRLGSTCNEGVFGQEILDKSICTRSQSLLCEFNRNIKYYELAYNKFNKLKAFL